MTASLDGVPVVRDIDRLAASLGGQALQLAGAGDVIGVPPPTAAALQLNGPIAPWGTQSLVLLDPTAIADAQRAQQIARAHRAAATAIELQALATTRRHEAGALEDDGPARERFAGAAAQLLRDSAQGLDLKAAAHREVAREMAAAAGVELDENAVDPLPF